MTTRVNPIPEGYKSAMPYLSVAGAAAAIAFYKEAFGAEETLRLEEPSGKVAHAEMRIGTASFSLADEYPEMNIRGPKSIGGTGVIIQVYVEDVDALFKRAEAAGATVKRAPTDEFYGDRSGTLEDPFGHVWMFQTHKEDVSPEEMKRRFAAFFAK